MTLNFKGGGCIRSQWEEEETHKFIQDDEDQHPHDEKWFVYTCVLSSRFIVAQSERKVRAPARRGVDYSGDSQQIFIEADFSGNLTETFTAPGQKRDRRGLISRENLKDYNFNFL